VNVATLARFLHTDCHTRGGSCASWVRHREQASLIISTLGGGDDHKEVEHLNDRVAELVSALSSARLVVEDCQAKVKSLNSLAEELRTKAEAAEQLSDYNRRIVGALRSRNHDLECAKTNTKQEDNNGICK
jgi:chromosome segregation ATPase